MRLDTFAEQFLSSLEGGLVRQFGNALSLLVVFGTTVCTFLGVIFWTAEQDVRVEAEMVSASQRVPSYIVEESAATDLSDKEWFTYAIIGGSESIRTMEEFGLSQSLNLELAHRGNVRVRAYDFCKAGIDTEYRYRSVIAASHLEPDLIIVTLSRWVTHTHYDVFTPFNRDKGFAFLKVRDFDSAIAIAHLTPPAIAIERWLSPRFPNYENRFEHSLAPILAPHRFEIVRINTKNIADEEGVEDRGMDRMLSESALSNEVDSEIVSKLRTKVFSHPGEAFELIARPAIERNIPLLFVITPVREKEIPATMDRSINPITRRFAQAPTDRISGKFLEAEDHLRENYTQIRMWQAYREEIIPKDEFFDHAHFRNFEPLAKRLAEVLDEEGFLPDE